MSMRMGWLLLLAVLVGPGLTLLTPQSVDAQPTVFRTVTVNCNAPGQTITNALKRYVPRKRSAHQLISGTCNENIDIFRDDVTPPRQTPPPRSMGQQRPTTPSISTDGERVTAGIAH